MRRGPSYSRGRVDARAGEARAFLAACRHLNNLTPRGLACQFNLKDATADQLLRYEQALRGGQTT